MDLFQIKELTKKHINKDELVDDVLYDIREVGLEVNSPQGYIPVIGFIQKQDKLATVSFDNGVEVKCGQCHLFIWPNGDTIKCKDLRFGDQIKTSHGLASVNSVIISDEQIELYDIMVDSNDRVFYDFNGILHHNTFTVEEELAKQGLKDGDGYFKNTGSTSTAALYETLYKYRKDIVLFDDCDAVFGDQDSRNILKSATDTKAKRKVAFNKKGSAYYDPAFQAEPEDDSQLPKYFDFEGKIIFISNLPMKKLDPDGALRTRGFFVELSPSNEEMLEFMGEILGKIQLNDGLSLTMAQRKEVLAFVREGGGERGSERISLRKLVRALNVRASFVDAPGDEWKTFVRNYS